VLLALDTATQAVTVALADASGVVAESTRVDALRHGELLAPAIADVLARTGIGPQALTRVAVGVGPGPFTGLRVGLMTARTMATALGVPVVGVCTLDVLAAAVQAREPFVVAIDARRKEVYWARFAASGARHSEPAVDKPADVAFEGPVAGHGASMYPDAFPRPIAPEYPSAGDLARLVLSGAATELPPEPLYLRRPDVTAPAARKSVS